ncbi:class I SAM-dependent methyltransferase [Planctomycetota bacterium]
MTTENRYMAKPKVTAIPAAKAYSSPAWWYDIRGFFILKLSYRDSLLRLIRFFAQNISKKHLEVAVGSGRFLQLSLLWRWIMRKPKASGEAFDYAPSMLLGAQRKFGKSPSWNIELADVGRMSYAKEQFETVNVANAFHCFPDPEQAAREIFRVLKAEGTLCVNALIHPRGPAWLKGVSERVNTWGIKKGILVSSFDLDHVKEIFVSAGFKLLEEKIHGNNLYLKLVKPGKKAIQ